MSYPKTSEQRLIDLYGYTQEDLLKLFILCDKNKLRYIEKVAQIDQHNATKCYNEMMDENTFVH